LCRDGVGDEYHYLFLCKNEAVFELRQKYIPSIRIIHIITTNTSPLFMYLIFTTHLSFKGARIIGNISQLTTTTIFRVDIKRKTCT
jgi:hypothetical protein